jgi:hypothetical protein
MNRTVKLLVLQAHRLLGVAIERWHDPEDRPEPPPSELVDLDLVKAERDRDELRRRGVDL